MAAPTETPNTQPTFKRKRQNPFEAAKSSQIVAAPTQSPAPSPPSLPAVAGLVAPQPAKHPGGRPKGSVNKRTLVAREIAATMKVDPVTFMLSVLNADVMEVVRTDKDGRVVLDENGQPIRDRIAVPMDMRMDAAKAVAPYVHPRLQAQTLTGPGDGPVQVTNIPVSEILKDPKMAGALSDLALLIAEADDDEASDD